MNEADISAVADFLSEHLPAARRSAPGQLLPWLRWYWHDGRVGIVRAENKIVAVGLARCVNDPVEADKPYFHDENGRILWVQDVISQHPAGLVKLLGIVVQRFGPREAIAGTVLSRDGELRKLPWNQVVRFLNGKNPNGLYKSA